MEEQNIVDNSPLAFQHANGNVAEAASMEAARAMCPVLGRMSLEDAGLLLELEAMGKGMIATQNTQVAKDVETRLLPAVAVDKPTLNTPEPLRVVLSPDVQLLELQASLDSSGNETEIVDYDAAIVAISVPDVDKPITVVATTSVEFVSKVINTEQDGQDLIVVQDAGIEKPFVETPPAVRLQVSDYRESSVADVVYTPAPLSNERVTLSEFVPPSIQTQDARLTPATEATELFPHAAADTPIIPEAHTIEETGTAEQSFFHAIPSEVQVVITQIQLAIAETESSDGSVPELLDAITEFVSENFQDEAAPTIDSDKALEALVTELLNELHIEPTEDLLHALVLIAKSQQLETILATGESDFPSVAYLSKRYGTNEFHVDQPMVRQLIPLNLRSKWMGWTLLRALRDVNLATPA